MELNKKGITAYCTRTEFVIGIISFIILSTLFFYLCGSAVGLKTNPAYAKGVIINNTQRGWKGRVILKYNFIVEGKEYRGSTRYDPDLQTINIGDTCFVLYEKDYPTNNKLIQVGKGYKIKQPE